MLILVFSGSDTSPTRSSNMLDPSWSRDFRVSRTVPSVCIDILKTHETSSPRGNSHCSNTILTECGRKESMGLAHGEISPNSSNCLMRSREFHIVHFACDTMHLPFPRSWVVLQESLRSVTQYQSKRWLKVLHSLTEDNFLCYDEIWVCLKTLTNAVNIAQSGKQWQALHWSGTTLVNVTSPITLLPIYRNTASYTAECI